MKITERTDIIGQMERSLRPLTPDMQSFVNRFYEPSSRLILDSRAAEQAYLDGRLSLQDTANKVSNNLYTIYQQAFRGTLNTTDLREANRNGFEAILYDEAPKYRTLTDVKSRNKKPLMLSSPGHGMGIYVYHEDAGFVATKTDFIQPKAVNRFVRAKLEHLDRLLANGYDVVNIFLADMFPFDDIVTEPIINETVYNLIEESWKVMSQNVFPELRTTSEKEVYINIFGLVSKQPQFAQKLATPIKEALARIFKMPVANLQSERPNSVKSVIGVQTGEEIGYIYGTNSGMNFRPYLAAMMIQ